MIQLLSCRFRKKGASLLFIVLYMQLVMPLYAAAFQGEESKYITDHNKIKLPDSNLIISAIQNTDKVEPDKAANNTLSEFSLSTPAIGGPTQPEVTSFKAVGSDNLVNLFTGDFSYSVPLLDVGGYPVNLFYSGGITMEQEASWVGLGWNINPGTVSRNMRGVPDDFNGTDLLTQTQNVKPNRTWGAEVGLDPELLGKDAPQINLSIGASYNNYQGPALDIGARVSLTIPIAENIKYEKNGSANLGLTASLGAKLSSRSGLTFSPSLNANLMLNEKAVKAGIGLNTSYNSRTGIKDLTIYSEMTAYRQMDLKEKDQTTTVSLNGNLGSSTISFAKPSYIPTLRIPMENAYYSGHIELLGAGMFGLKFTGNGTGYYSESKVPVESRIIKKPLVGFMYSEKANNNQDAVMDFTRVNDAEVTPNTPVISAPQYAYDVFSIQGEGTGGSIRAYRGDLGFMRDNVTVSKDKNISIGVDIAPPGHYGGNWNIISTPTRVGGWEDANNTLLQTMAFKPAQNNSSFENIYFKNPGESTVTSSEILNRIGGDDLVRFKLSGSNANPRLESQLEKFNKNTGSSKGIISVAANSDLTKRDKRTQVITMLTAEDAARVGLEKQIRNYTGTFNGSNNIVYDTITRVGSYRKAHHISEIDVLEQGGMRYVYGIPVYNTVQKDFTFSVGSSGNVTTNLVGYTSDEPTTGSQHMTNSSKIDGYVQVQETPAYASGFLITGLLSPDYVDVTGDGITEDDLGGSVKFNYTKSDSLHRWRTPRNNSGAMQAHFNEGVRTEKKDNKATISYGEREAWYLNSIESKSMVAIFKTEARNDAKGVHGEMDGTVNSSEIANKKLTRIDLYTKAEIKAKGITNARPLKTVQFEYGYALCSGSPDNASGGKLTLKSVYFSFNGQPRQVKDRYVFNYGDTTSQTYNPSYAYNASDRWSTYKDPSLNPSGLSNIDYPYTSTNKTKNDQYAAAWSLRKILLPSGGQMEIQYEADDYGYVQNRRACNMYNIYGFGKTTSHSSDSSLYTLGVSTADNLYVYIKLDEGLVNTDATKQKQEIYSKYLEGINQLAFKLQIRMPKGWEPLTVYSNYDDYGFCTGTNTDRKYIYIKLRSVDGKSPLAKSSIGFLTENLPGQAFPGYDIEVDGVQAFLAMAGSMIGSLKNAFKNVDQQMRAAAKGRMILRANSFIRLDDPDRIKYGGGVRVKKVLVKDNWNKMTNQYNSVYGQEYSYTMTENINGKDSVFSSGVASYEPGIGSEENPFREIVSFSNKLPLASAQYGAIEMPMLEALYPSPCVGYSKVTIRSIHRKGTHGDSAVRSAIGKQVTEFYTAKDYPSYSTFTPMSSMDYNKKPFLSLLYKEIIDRRVISQGFLVETNDMHGRMRSQIAYSESDEKTPLSYSYHTYKNTGKNGLNDKVDFIYNEEKGAVHKGNMGIDVELMIDVREFRLQSNGFNGQIQTDFFSFVPWPIFVIPFLPVKTYTENKYRAVTCTKLINYHAIEDSVIVMDKGSVITTKTTTYDAETGSPIVTRTANEFNDSIYNTSLPAYWAYSGTGLAYKNIERRFVNVNFYDGKILSSSNIDTTIFESGDELYITNQGTAPSDDCGDRLASPTTTKLWAFDKNKDTTAFTMPVKNLVFMDDKGKLFTKAGVSFRIIRSGRRNNLGLTVGAVTSMQNPVRTISGSDTLLIDKKSIVLAASAVEYKEKWQTDNDVIQKRKYYSVIDTCVTTSMDSLDCNGIFETNINPYVKGLIGNFKPFRSYTYYGERGNSDASATTAIRSDGYISLFKNYWLFNSNSNLVHDVTETKWVWNSQLTKVNSKGQELETKDALNRYTAGQYGFNKNMIVAMVQNARYGEGVAEAFEDYSYAETINNATQNTCEKKYIDFSGLTNGTIVNMEDSTIKAHSGKYALKVNANSQVVKPLTIRNGVLDSFALQMKANSFGLDDPRDTISGLMYYRYCGSSLINTLTTLTSQYIDPNTPIELLYSGGTTNPCITYYIEDEGSYSPLLYNKFHYFTTVPASGHISFTARTYQGAGYASVSIRSSISHSTDMSLNYLPGSDTSFYVGSLVIPSGFNCDSFGTHPLEKTVTLDYCEGTVLEVLAIYDPNPVGFSYSCDTTGMHYLNPLYGASFSCSQATKKTYTNGTTCYNHLPIPGADRMLNPVLNLVPGKRMQFSAWVREECGTTLPCYKTRYAKSHIELQFTGGSGGTVSIYPTGAIIDGWQKVEGAFTVPAGVTSANLVLSNDSAQKIYWDDIRIHPFNANMKSYVYDPRTLRLAAELDENNYTSFYEYDEEGQLVRVKKETIQGIKTIQETRSAKQKGITDLQ